MNDIIAQFARLWGQHEAYMQSAKDIVLSEKLKSFDSEEMLHVITGWADEYMKSDIEDSVEFFEKKLEEYMDKIEI
jgi:hypothetical protein